MLKALAENVKKHRESKGITQLELAAKAKLSISTISEVESRRVADVRLSTVVAIAEVLGVEDPLKLFRR